DLWPTETVTLDVGVNVKRLHRAAGYGRDATNRKKSSGSSARPVFARSSIVRVPPRHQNRAAVSEPGPSWWASPGKARRRSAVTWAVSLRIAQAAIVLRVGATASAPYGPVSR